MLAFLCETSAMDAEGFLLFSCEEKTVARCIHLGLCPLLTLTGINENVILYSHGETRTHCLAATRSTSSRVGMEGAAPFRATAIAAANAA